MGGDGGLLEWLNDHNFVAVGSSFDVELRILLSGRVLLTGRKHLLLVLLFSKALRALVLAG